MLCYFLHTVNKQMNWPYFICLDISVLCTVTLWYEILRWYCSIRVGFGSYSFYVQGTYMKTTEHKTSSLVCLTGLGSDSGNNMQYVLTCLWPRVMAEYNCPQHYLVNDFHNNFSKRKPRRISTPFSTRNSFFLQSISSAVSILTTQ